MLGTYFLKEKLGTLGKIGCAICLTGSVIIVLHAPPDKEVETIDQILEYAIKPGMHLFRTCAKSQDIIDTDQRSYCIALLSLYSL